MVLRIFHRTSKNGEKQYKKRSSKYRYQNAQINEKGNIGWICDMFKCAMQHGMHYTRKKKSYQTFNKHGDINHINN